MRKAEALFNETTSRLMRLQGVIASFKNASKAGLKSSQDEIYQSNQISLNAVLQDQRLLDAFSKENINPSVVFKDAAKKITEKMSREAYRGIDAASIIFAHSSLDATAHEYCLVTRYLDPPEWESEVSEMKIKMSDVKSSSFETLLTIKLEEYFKKLERESLMTKIKHLFRICKPPSGWIFMNDYKYDSNKIEKLDDLRHRIIHGDGLDYDIPNAGEDSWYLFKTGLYIMGLVNHRYKLKLIPALFNVNANV